MIEFAKILGETEGSSIRVKIRTGETFMAPMAIVGNSSPLPSAAWIAQNKDNFLALVTYEKDLYISPIVIGFYPVNNADATKYDVIYQFLDLVETLVTELTAVKTVTMLGPQPFFPDSLAKLQQMKLNMVEIKKQVLGL